MPKVSIAPEVSPSAFHNDLVRTRWRREHGESALGGGRAACHARTHSSARVSKRQLSPLPPVRLPTLREMPDQKSTISQQRANQSHAFCSATQLRSSLVKMSL